MGIFADGLEMVLPTMYFFHSVRRAVLAYFNRA
jgi:hypothetical protein